MYGVSDLTERPLVTFVLLAFNQELYVRQAVEAALEQDYSPLEIILSDDCSTDSTFEHMKSLVDNYTGPHAVILNRNLVNRGLARHFNELVSKARGEIVVVAAGDDISLPCRVSKTVGLFREYPDASVVCFTDTVIDGSGVTISKSGENPLSESKAVSLEDYISGRVRHLSGASRGFRKRVYEVFGDLNDSCPTEDTPYLLRSLMIGSGVISSEPAIFYRRHSGNLSAGASLHSMSVDEICRQHSHDLKTASVEGFVDQERAVKIQAWIDRTFRRRSLAAKLAKSTNKWGLFIGSVLPSNDFTLREKMSLLKSILRQ